MHILSKPHLPLQCLLINISHSSYPTPPHVNQVDHYFSLASLNSIDWGEAKVFNSFERSEIPRLQEWAKREQVMEKWEGDTGWYRTVLARHCFGMFLDRMHGKVTTQNSPFEDIYLQDYSGAVSHWSVCLMRCQLPTFWDCITRPFWKSLNMVLPLVQNCLEDPKVLCM